MVKADMLNAVPKPFTTCLSEALRNRTFQEGKREKNSSERAINNDLYPHLEQVTSNSRRRECAWVCLLSMVYVCSYHMVPRISQVVRYKGRILCLTRKRTH